MVALALSVGPHAFVQQPSSNPPSTQAGRAPDRLSTERLARRCRTASRRCSDLIEKLKKGRTLAIQAFEIPVRLTVVYPKNTTALLDRLTHICYSPETSGDKREPVTHLACRTSSISSMSTDFVDSSAPDLCPNMSA
jgi:hypothetical protein